MGLFLSLCLHVAAAAVPAPVPWSELALSIEEDRGVSGDGATLCRVRVVNHGRGTWQGRDILFEARALREGRVAVVSTGRFGRTIGPHETLETLIGFEGRFDRFEVAPLLRAVTRERTAKAGRGKKRAGRGGPPTPSRRRRRG